MYYNFKRGIEVLLVLSIIVFTSFTVCAGVKGATLCGEDIEVELGVETVDVNVILETNGVTTLDSLFFKAIPSDGLKMISVAIPEEYAQYDDLTNDVTVSNNLIWISQSEYEVEYVAAPSATFTITYEIADPTIDKSYRVKIVEETAMFDLGDCTNISVVKDAIVTVGAGSELPEEEPEQEPEQKPEEKPKNEPNNEPVYDEEYIPYQPIADTLISVADGEFDGKALKEGDIFSVPVTVNEWPNEEIYSVKLAFEFNKAIVEFVGVEGVMKPVSNRTTVLSTPGKWSADVKEANETGRIIATYAENSNGGKGFGPLSIRGNNGTTTLLNLKFKLLNSSVHTLLDFKDAQLISFINHTEEIYTASRGALSIEDGKLLFKDGIIVLLPDAKAPEKPKEEPKEEKPVEEPKEEVKVTFADLDGFQWAEEAIYELVAKGIVNGKSETSYDPASNVTRAEFAKLIVAAFNMTLDGEAAVYTDVTESDWFSKYVAIASSKGIVKGYEDGTFKPNANITREEMCVMLERALKGIELETKESAFADNDSISDWAKSAVDLLSANGIINGRDGNMFAPQGTATRAESAVAIFRTLKNALNK